MKIEYVIIIKLIWLYRKNFVFFYIQIKIDRDIELSYKLNSINPINFIKQQN